MRELPGDTIVPGAKLYYPSRMALSPDGQTAFVVSANFDQRFYSGWLTRVDVPALLSAATQGGDATSALSREVAVPSLGGDFIIDGTRKRGYLAHRGLGLVTALDLDTTTVGAAQLSCGAAGEGLSGALARTSCDASHVFDLKGAVGEAYALRDDPTLEHFDDAFALTQWSPPDASEAPSLVAGLQRGQRMAVLRDDGPPGLALEGLLPTGTHGILAVAAAPQGPLVASSRARDYDSPNPLVRDDATLLALPSLAQALLQRPGDSLPLPLSNYSLSRDLGSLQQRSVGDGRLQIAALMFVPGRTDRVVALSHSPDAVLWMGLSSAPESTVDVGGDASVEAGPLRWQPLGAAMIPRSGAHALTYLSRAQGDLVVAASLAQDMLYFFDPTGDDLQLVHRLALPDGAGPFGLVATQVAGRELLLVSTFFDHGLSVVDVSTPSYADFAVVTSVHDDLFSPAPRHR